ncbi:MAG: 23S rRNA (adenine(2503)-C(2))-methyltransferase RlmN [Planctomycetes bacterium]|nr:23S rRNA (adenine(2503)-C(2))-methyltransferase RlmN [Planctomycetota bacterium]
MDVLGVTFDEVREALGVKPHEVKALRAEYRAALAGRDNDRMRADLLPVVRCVEDGDLTKFIQRTHDGLETESVMVPMRRHGKEWKSLCVSSQVGCARGCLFCETGQIGLVRNLTPSEIVGQVAVVRTRFGQEVRNIVFMGMGEPFDNFDNVIQAVRVLNDPAGLSISCERIAISTVGRIEGIRRLAALGLRRLNLAISLNAPNDDIRSKIMPVNRLEPMGELREALLAYPLRKCQFFMIEYVLIPGVNDRHEHALELADYLRPLKCVVNVIPYNPRHESPWPAPDEQTIKQFIAWLKEQRQVVKRRLTKGRENMAACGQLGNREIARPRRSWVAQPAARTDLVGG